MTMTISHILERLEELKDDTCVSSTQQRIDTAMEALRSINQPLFFDQDREEIQSAEKVYLHVNGMQVAITSHPDGVLIEHTALNTKKFRSRTLYVDQGEMVIKLGRIA